MLLHLYYDFPLFDFAEFILKYSDDIRSAGFNILTLPGEALTDDAGTSYYVINKNAASDAVSKYIFGKKCDFDPESKFKSRTDKSFINSYEKDIISYILEDEDMGDKAYEIAEKKVLTILKGKDKPEIKDLRKVNDYLLRQGFSFDEVSSAIERIKEIYE